ncbi:hypothetical protein ACGFY7_39080 [Streptomyces prunicolor]|uniref:hypothetical protein n=1 Tax=Streptomyces prunicolor TaxID=67348 RepID=UPI003719D48E
MPTESDTTALLVSEVSGLDPKEANQAETAFRTLRKAILDGVVPPGATIDGADLANDYKIDGEVVRAVLKGLTHNGLARGTGRSVEVTEPSNRRPAQRNRSATSSKKHRRRWSMYYSAFGETKTLSQWTDDARCRVDYRLLYARINVLGWEVERALTALPGPRSSR